MTRQGEKYMQGTLRSRFSDSSKYLLSGLSPRTVVRGRTLAQWGRFLLFYLIFYSILAAMSLCLWWIFSLTLNPRTPRHLTSESLIGTNPGLGFRPLPSSENVLSSLIWYQGTKNESFFFWTKSLKDFLEVYKRPGLTPGRGQNIYNCDFDRPPKPGQVCDVDVKLLAPCTEENYFMYHQSSPCVLLKLNKIYGWRPDFYKDPKELPADMPKHLKERITHLAKSPNPTDQAKLNTIWVSCKGESPADAEFIGVVDYHPMEGFPGFFFPYENSEGYLSPLVAVHFKRPKPGVLINIECRAWAKNILYRHKDKQGSVHFELMID